MTAKFVKDFIVYID